MTSLEDLQDYLKQKLVGSVTSCELSAQGELTLEVPVDDWTRVATFLRYDECCCFEQLIDLCGVDYLTYGQAEWDVSAASPSGFSRAVKENDLFDFDQGESNNDFDGQRYAVVVHLLSLTKNRRMRMRTYCKDNDFPVLYSLVQTWNSANWYEREVFDLFGIMFDGHPDLRRILTDYGFIGHPFRKDFPLTGQVEMRYDPEQKRVIYEPVSIEPRTLVPRVIRGEHPVASEGTDA